MIMEQQQKGKGAMDDRSLGVSVPFFVRVRFKSAVFSNRLTTTLLSTVTQVKIPVNVCFKGILTDHAVSAKLICVFVFAYAKSRLLSWLT